MRSAPRAVFGKGITSRIELSPARIITIRSRPSAMPPCGGAPYSSASSRKPKRRFGFLLAETESGEDLRLHVTAVNTDRTRGQLHAIQHQVIRLGTAVRGIGD